MRIVGDMLPISGWLKESYPMPNSKSPAPMSVEEAVKTFGKRVALARFKKGYTQVSLAKYVDLSVESIVKIENGDRSPSISSLIKLAIELDVSLDWLVLGKSDSHLLDTGDKDLLREAREYVAADNHSPNGYAEDLVKRLLAVIPVPSTEFRDKHDPLVRQLRRAAPIDIVTRNKDDQITEWTRVIG